MSMATVMNCEKQLL